MLPLNLINVTQCGLRDGEQLAAMTQHASGGGFFDLHAINSFNKYTNSRQHHPSLIRIVRFEDGKLYVADGHHRLMAIFLAGRSYVHESEYEILDYRYIDFILPNFNTGWLTPFDPRKEVRNPDIKNFKMCVRSMLELSPDDAKEFIEANKSAYLRKRTINSVEELAMGLGLLQ